MSRNTRSDYKDARLRHTAVKRYRTGIPTAEVARQLNRSRSWVYKWVDYRAHHPWTRFRSAPVRRTIIPINSRPRACSATRARKCRLYYPSPLLSLFGSRIASSVEAFRVDLLVGRVEVTN